MATALTVEVWDRREFIFNAPDPTRPDPTRHDTTVNYNVGL